METINEFKVYGLKLKGSDEIRYVGMTKWDLKKRLQGHFKQKVHNQPKNDWVKENRHNIEIVLFEGNIDSIELAYEKEQFYISYFKDKGDSLFNATIGGVGTQGMESWNKGIPCSYTDKLIKNSPRDRKVFCYDLDGNFISEYRSLKHAAKVTGANRQVIKRVADNIQRYKQTNGFIFKWYQSEKIEEYAKDKKGTAVTCLETGECFDSMVLAAKKFDSSLSKIQRIVKNGVFSIYDLENKKEKKVICLDTNQTFSSVSEASRHFNIGVPLISGVIKGTRKTTHGFRFAYL